MWQPEEIPDSADLFMRVHRDAFDFAVGKPKPVAFKNRPPDMPGAGMSTDWSQYSTPEETRARARQPVNNAVISLGVAAVRALPGQRVVHTPQQPDAVAADPHRRAGNRAHTEVFGEKKRVGDVMVRQKLQELCEVVIRLKPE